MANSCFICSSCNTQTAVEFCCCGFPCQPLCQTCMDPHMRKSSSEVHVFAPITLNPTNPQQLSTLRQRLFSLGESKARLNYTLTEIVAAQIALRENKETLVRAVSDYVDEQLQSLEQLRQVLESQMDAAFESARQQMLQSAVQGNDLTTLLWTSSQTQQFSCLGLFSATLSKPTPMSPQDLVGVSWSSLLLPSGQVNYSTLLPIKPELEQLQTVLCERGVPLCSASPQLLRLNALFDSATQQIPLMLAVSHLFCYFRDAVPKEISPALEAVSRCSFSPEHLANCESLEYLLTQEQRFSAVDLAVIASDLRSYNPPPALVEVRPDHVRVFDCLSRQWKSKVALASSLPVDSLSVLTFLPSGKVFVCGGENSASTYQVDAEKGFILQLNDMKTPRKAHGLQLFYGRIYVFGGKRTDNAIENCEKYSINHGSWTALSSNMLKPRSHFSPCLHRHLIYLCGGNSYHSEVFNPQTEAFTALSGNLPEDSGCRTVIWNEQLVVVSYGLLSIRPLTGAKYATKKKENFRCSGQTCATIRLDSRLWFTCWNPAGTVFCFDLQTATLETTISYG